MSDQPDDQPVVPPRSLGRPGNSSPNGPGQYSPAQYPAQQQRAVSGQYSGSYAPSGQQGERGLPVPPLASQGGGPGGASARGTDTLVDKRAEKQNQRSGNRNQASRPRTVRRAKLRVVHVDPWSVTKASFLLSIAFGIMCVVAVFLIFSIMSASGLWDSVNNTIQGVVDQKPKDAFDIKDYVGMSRVMGITMLISAIDVVIITALATLGAFIYNMSASLLGGVEITLAEDLR
jgi:Transmembrane domain of unknown function (DUF3566)